jgi:hypothetical protein
LCIRSSRKRNCTVRDVSYDCMYGSTRGTSEQARHEDEAWERVLFGGKRDAIALGQGCKMDCPYAFTLKVYTARKDIAFVKFMLPKNTAGVISFLSMNHSNAEGNLVHQGLHARIQYTAEVRDLVQQHLKAHCAVRVINLV